MTRELKIALLIGFCLVLVVSVLIADHLSAARNAKLAEASGEKMPLVHDPLDMVADIGPGTGIQPGPLALSNPANPLDQATGVMEPVVAANGSQDQWNVGQTPDAYAMTGPLTVQAPAVSPTNAPVNVASTPTAGADQPYTLVQGSGRSAASLPNPAISAPHSPEMSLADAASQAGGRLVNGTLELPVAAKVDFVTTSVPATPAKTPAKPEVKSVTSDLPTYTVKSGDNLYKIAKKQYGNGDNWKLLADANKDKISKNGNLKVGTSLRVPAIGSQARQPVILASAAKPDIRATTPGRLAEPTTKAPKAALAADTKVPGKSGSTYTVKSGDSLGRISQATLGTSKRVEEILALNKGKLADADSIQVGMTLQIPSR